MNKLFFISTLLLTTSHLFGQVSHATASATIVIPVGAEISGEINDVNIFNKNVKTRPVDEDINHTNPDSNRDEKGLSFLKIIGETFSHYVTVEDDHAFIQREKENEETSTAGNHKFVRITVNFD